MWPRPAGRGEEYLLRRGLYRRLSTGEVINPRWGQFSFPHYWHFDVLRGLDYLRDAGAPPDDRLDEAVEVVERNRGDDGRWPLQNVYTGEFHFDMEAGEGPSEPLEHAPRAASSGLVQAGRIVRPSASRAPSSGAGGEVSVLHLPGVVEHVIGAAPDQELDRPPLPGGRSRSCC